MLKFCFELSVVFSEKKKSKRSVPNKRPGCQSETLLQLLSKLFLPFKKLIGYKPLHIL